MVDVDVSLRYESLTAHGFRRSVLFSRSYKRSISNAAAILCIRKEKQSSLSSLSSSCYRICFPMHEVFETSSFVAVPNNENRLKMVINVCSVQRVS